MSTTNIDSEIVLRFDLAIYRLIAIKKAAYKYTDRSIVQLKTLSEREVEVTLRARIASLDLQKTAEEYSNEVLDQELRESILEETKGIRNLLIAQAFSHTSLIDPSGEYGDYRADPLNIQRPDDK